MKLWLALLHGLLVCVPASVDASAWENSSSGWLFLAAAALFIIPATLAFVIFIFRVNRKLKAIVAAGQRASLMQQNRSRILSMIVEQAPLLQVLDALVEGAQQMDPSASCTVLLLDDQTYKANTEPMLSHINVGTGVDCTIGELAQTMQRVVGFKGKLVFDTSKPDGTPRKLMNVERLKNLGWQYSIDLETGLQKTYQWFLDNVEGLRQV